MSSVDHGFLWYLKFGLNRFRQIFATDSLVDSHEVFRLSKSFANRERDNQVTGCIQVQSLDLGVLKCEMTKAQK